ncbi:uncharacterized protein AB675_2275 [Cyphellophora attinorum]|uniref:Pleckstrin homology domain-containing protein n=1 Tax=Cyphellophora attinorum TaxID=1664694 RepID=A0A0N0NI05_9EURO|nr:uncharacterized protein AB675_2275 [Phialophora attinorum]KPI34889.1 hypothetical protein AB675_2275 [Phialophora attinorum]
MLNFTRGLGMGPQKGQSISRTNRSWVFEVLAEAVLRDRTARAVEKRSWITALGRAFATAYKPTRGLQVNETERAAIRVNNQPSTGYQNRHGLSLHPPDASRPRTADPHPATDPTIQHGSHQTTITSDAPPTAPSRWANILKNNPLKGSALLTNPLKNVKKPSFTILRREQSTTDEKPRTPKSPDKRSWKAKEAERRRARLVEEALGSERNEEVEQEQEPPDRMASRRTVRTQASAAAISFATPRVDTPIAAQAAPNPSQFLAESLAHVIVVPIKLVFEVPNRLAIDGCIPAHTMPYDYSIVVVAPSKVIKVTAPDEARHNAWLTALQYLVDATKKVTPESWPDVLAARLALLTQPTEALFGKESEIPSRAGTPFIADKPLPPSPPPETSDQPPSMVPPSIPRLPFHARDNSNALSSMPDSADSLSDAGSKAASSARSQRVEPYTPPLSGDTKEKGPAKYESDHIHAPAIGRWTLLCRACLLESVGRPDGFSTRAKMYNGSGRTSCPKTNISNKIPIQFH